MIRGLNRVFILALLGHRLGSPQADSHEPLHHVHGRQHHFHLPYYDGVYDGLATHSSTYGHFSHFQDAGEFKSEVSSRLGLSHWEPDGFGIGSLQVPVHGTVAYTCIRLASLY